MKFPSRIRSLAISAIAVAASVTVTGCAPSEKQIADWIDKNPEAILKSVDAFQRKQREDNQPKPEMATTYKADLFEHASSPTAGTGPVKIAYFFDFNCGHCAKQSETIEAYLKKAGGDVTVVYKNFPILSPTSELAARAALAAHQQGKYKDFYKEVYQTQQKTPESMLAIAKKIKLDIKKWETDMDGAAVKGELDHVRELAQKMKIGGTPFLAIAPDKVIPGRVDELEQLVASVKK